MSAEQTKIIEGVYVVSETIGYEKPKWSKTEPTNTRANIEFATEPIVGVYLPTPSLNIVIVDPLPTLDSINWDIASSYTPGALRGNIKSGQEWFWTKEWQAAEKEVEADLAAGRFETFDTMEDFLADLE